VKLFRRLDEVERDARGALDRSARGSLFERLDWFRLLETHCPPPGKLLVIRARAGEASAWLFLKTQGPRATAMTNWYSLSFGTIMTSADRQKNSALAEALVAGLRRARIAVLELSPVCSRDVIASVLGNKLWLRRITPTTVRWSIDTADKDFAAYWAERPSRLRSTAERKARAAGLTVRILSEWDEQAWADYEQVYRSSWKGEEGSPAFLRALARQEAAAGALRLGLAYKDGAPVAAQFWLTEGKLATIHKLAYVEEFKPLSPGTVLSMAMFRHALDVDGVNRIDFGLGDEPYKADWMAHKQELHRLVAYHLLSPTGLWWAGRAAGGALVRRLRND
jgi:CelD/BcsL family acetyltransferase involved in cellulose biosynthesis